MLKISELNKTYSNGIQALREISLDVPNGMFGLLGPNGAGKTTLMKILATLLEPDSGTAEMNGIDLIGDKHSTRKMFGYLTLPESNGRTDASLLCETKGRSRQE